MQDRGGIRVRRRMDKSKGVPTDQQPFNELQELKEDVLFGWAQEDFKVRVPQTVVGVALLGPVYQLRRRSGPYIATTKQKNVDSAVIKHL